MKPFLIPIAHRSHNLRKFFTRLVFGTSIDKNCSVFCNNCVGAMVLHDLGLRFNSPTVNLAIPPADFVELLSNLQYYLSLPIDNITDAGGVKGLIDNKLHINFIHYSTFEKAVDAWNRRVRRIDYNNLYAVLVQKDGCTSADVKRFLSLDNYNKIVLVEENFPMQDKRIIKIKNCSQNGELKDVLDYSSVFGKRYYDQVNWTKFLKRFSK